MKTQDDAAASPDRPRRNLVPTIAQSLRDRIFEGEPDERLGSLTELADEYGVGIVTIQQVARILEHEGLLEVRRGPGGGYYGRRPDARSLERGLAAFMRMHPDSYGEALDITSLLFIELCGAAARCSHAGLQAELRALLPRFSECSSETDIGIMETDLQDLLFRMVDRPIFELLTRVTLHFSQVSGGPHLHRGSDGLRRWIDGRRKIVAAIAEGDEPLARFEADRNNRQVVLVALSLPAAAPPSRR